MRQLATNTEARTMVCFKGTLVIHELALLLRRLFLDEDYSFVPKTMGVEEA
jgi:hypothetical protein